MKRKKFQEVALLIALLVSFGVYMGCDDVDDPIVTIPQTVQELWNEQTDEVSYPTSGITTEDRIKGAIMGTMIGDALGVGCHWYYDFEGFWADYGTWVDDYVDPNPNPDASMRFPDIPKLRYDAGVRGGWNSQSGELIQILLEVVSANTNQGANTGNFDATEYIAAIEDFFDNRLRPAATFDGGQIDGQHIDSLSGRYTNMAIKENFDAWYNNGAKDGDWSANDELASTMSTSEPAQFGVILAALYRDPEVLAPIAYDFTRMWFSDPAFISNNFLYIMTVQAVINGVPLDNLADYIRKYAFTTFSPYIAGDDFLLPTNTLDMIKRPQIFPFPDDRFVPLMFGHGCHQAHLLPAAYYFAYKYADDFEEAILTSVNSAGNNMARSAMAGGLVGAMVGINGIPERFIDGLANDPLLIPAGSTQSKYLLEMAQDVADGTNGAIPVFSAPAH